MLERIPNVLLFDFWCGVLHLLEERFREVGTIEPVACAAVRNYALLVYAGSSCSARDRTGRR